MQHQKVAVFRTSGGLRRCGKCGGLLASPPKRVSTAIKTNVRMIGCGMCGERHPVDADCNTADWLRQMARKSKAKKQAESIPLPYGDLSKRAGR